MAFFSPNAMLAFFSLSFQLQRMYFRRHMKYVEIRYTVKLAKLSEDLNGIRDRYFLKITYLLLR